MGEKSLGVSALNSALKVDLLDSFQDWARKRPNMIIKDIQLKNRVRYAFNKEVIFPY